MGEPTDPNNPNEPSKASRIGNIVGGTMLGNALYKPLGIVGSIGGTALGSVLGSKIGADLGPMFSDPNQYSNPPQPSTPQQNPGMLAFTNIAGQVAGGVAGGAALGFLSSKLLNDALPSQWGLRLGALLGGMVALSNVQNINVSHNSN
jgi:hypothetical protein